MKEVKGIKIYMNQQRLPIEMKGWDQAKIKCFRADLLRWYDQNKRDLPWRRTRDPYCIWVSEIMLQQTQVATVIPYYERFIATLPTIQDLAQAEEQTLLNLWQGLGYYSRVRNMQQAAQQIMRDYGGKMPRTLVELLALKGIGPYTAAAIGSMAFDLVEPALDGNLFRIVARLFEVEADIALPKSRKVFMAILYALIDPERPGDFNQALMDLGATIMTASNPFPEAHPLAVYDQSYQNGTAANYPVKSKKVKQTVHDLLGYMVINPQGQWLMRQHQAQELLAGLWHFPLIEQSLIAESGTSAEWLEPFNEWWQSEVEGDFILKLDSDPMKFKPIKHVFSHRIWQVQLVMVRCEVTAQLPPNCIWCEPSAIGRLPLSTLQQKLLRQVVVESEAI